MLLLWGAVPIAELGAQNRHLQKANELYEATAYPAAITAYEKALKEDQKDRAIMLRLGECYWLTHQYRQAEAWFKRGLAGRNGLKQASNSILFQYAQALMANRKYESARDILEEYLDRVPGDEQARNMLEACQDQESFARNQSLYKLRRIPGLNTEVSDFGAAIYAGSLVFASARSRGETYDRTGQTFLDLYAASYEGHYKLGEPKLFRIGVNTPYHEATACFSADGKEMYFTRNNYYKGKMGTSEDGVVHLATYRAELVDGKWSEEELLPFNSEEYSVGHPALSPDGQRLFFASNMPGGFGGTDLYYVDRTAGGWSEPVNLGNAINTAGNEMFPWVDERWQLFFASNGHLGMGGLDVFRIQIEGDSYHSFENLGEPINSSRDDFGFVFDYENNVGFVTSNRPGGKGDDDIYALEQRIPVLGLVRDEQGNAVADVSVMLTMGRAQTFVGTDENGQFLVGMEPNAIYTVTFYKAGWEEQKQEMNTTGLSASERQVMMVTLQPVPEEQ